MIYKWNELPYEDFVQIFFDFANGVDYTENKVLEIQNPLNIILGKPESRIFFSRYFKMMDYPEYNKEALESLNKLTSVVPDLKEEMAKSEIFDMCMLSRDCGPLVTPIAAKLKGGFDVILGTMFGDSKYDSAIVRNLNTKTPMILWYTKDESGSRRIDIEKDAHTKYSDKERMFRFRTIDYDPDWKGMVDLWTTPDSDNSEFLKDDLKKEQIQVYPGMASLIFKIKELLR